MTWIKTRSYVLASVVGPQKNAHGTLNQAFVTLLGGRQPPDLTARKLMDDTRLPLDWNEQRRALGFVQSH